MLNNKLIILAACPANCKVCQSQGKKTICNSGQCLKGYGRSSDGAACVGMSSVLHVKII